MPRKNNTTEITVDTPNSLTADIVFKSAEEKGGEKHSYSAKITFLSQERMLIHALEHVKWNLQKLANKGEFPRGRKVEVLIGERIQVKETFEDTVAKLERMSKEERSAMERELVEKLKALQAAQAVR